MNWVKVKWLPPLFAAFDTIAPGRGKASDGTIGDVTHQAETSGHNPDDTPGVSAERSDPDSIPEVRAGDVTSDLRVPGLTMYQVVRNVLFTPRDRDRLIYIICDGWIWRKANGWSREKYSGSDQHFGHAHFSGDPASDEDGAPWTSILSMGADMEQSDPLISPWAANNVGNAFAVVMETRRAAMVDDASTGYGPPAPASMAGRIRDIQAKVGTMAGGGVSQDMIDAAVKVALTDPAVIGPLVKAINDDAARRAAE